MVMTNGTASNGASRSQHVTVLAPPKPISAELIPSPGAVAILPLDTPFAKGGLNLFKSDSQSVKGAQIQIGEEEIDTTTKGIVWLDSTPNGIPKLDSLLEKYSNVAWVQLPMAGINAYATLVNKYLNKVWTSAKGAYSQPVAEHAFTLTLALLRYLPMRIQASSWGPSQGNSLFHSNIVILGAGGITLALLSLLEPFSPTVTILRRKAEPLEDSVVPSKLKHLMRYATLGELDDVLPQADVVVAACALTPDTRSCLAKAQFEKMQNHALVINVARGEVINTDDLVVALREGQIGGAGLDVTAPEPLPRDHPLWHLETKHDAIKAETESGTKRANLIITPHTANTAQQSIPLYSERVRLNVKALLARNGCFEGVVDAAAGY